MPAPTSSAAADGVSFVNKGMNSGMAPRLLPASQLAFAINVTCRGGMPRTRPAWRKVALTYVDLENEAANSTELRATQGLFQNAHFYQAVGSGESCLVASIGGRLFRYLVGSSYRVQDISVAGDLNDSRNPNCWMWQGEDFLFVNNGAANPLIFDGAGTRRSQGDAGEELPAGCQGIYVQGRNWMVLPDANHQPTGQFIASDLVNSHGFQDGYNGRAAIIRTEENTFLSGGGAFSVPIQAGRITAFASVAIADTSLGQGPLQVLTQNSVFSVSVPVLREDWVSTQYPLMTVGLPNYGAVGADAVCTVNGDVWYRSLDGLRSYQVGRRDLGTWVNTPLSVEMEAVLSQDADLFLGKCNSVLFSNRLLFTCAPRDISARGTYHQGLVALDFNNISTLTSRSEPAYDGLWTGLNILKLVKGSFHGTERCFAFALDCNANICLFELLQDGAAWFDWDGEDEIGIESSFETKALGWSDNGNQLKKLLALDLYMDRLAGPATGEMDFRVTYRSDQDPVWRDWHNWQLCAPVRDCETASCPTFANVREQFATYVRLPDPRDICSEVTKRMTRTGYEFQVRMWWKGFGQLNRMHIWAQQLSDSVVQACPTSQTCTLLKGCGTDWFSYSLQSCDAIPTLGPVGLVWEDRKTWIGTENPRIIIRGEHQTPYRLPPIPVGEPNPVDAPLPPPVAVGDPTPVGQPPLPPTPVDEPQVIMPPPADPTPFGCPGETVLTADPLKVIDPLTGEENFVGIQPGSMDPNDYMVAAGAEQALAAWTNAVWSEFVAQGITYSQARVEWAYIHNTQKDWMATQVFPSQPGGYIGVIDLDYKLVVRYCP